MADMVFDLVYSCPHLTCAACMELLDIEAATPIERDPLGNAIATVKHAKKDSACVHANKDRFIIIPTLPVYTKRT